MRILKCDKVVVDSGSMTAYLEEDPVVMLHKGRLIIFDKPECPSWDWAIRQVLEQGEERMAEKRFCGECGALILWIPQKSGIDLITPEARKLAEEIKALQDEYGFSFNEAIDVIRRSR